MKPTRIKIDNDTTNDNIIVSTFQSLSTGVSIRKLDNVVFFASYKSEVKVLQSIGRGLRTHASKSGMTLWDVVDDMTYTEKRKIHNFTYNHWLKYRLEYYKEQMFEYETYSINI